MGCGVGSEWVGGMGVSGLVGWECRGCWVRVQPNIKQRKWIHRQAGNGGKFDVCFVEY